MRGPAAARARRAPLTIFKANGYHRTYATWTMWSAGGSRRAEQAVTNRRLHPRVPSRQRCWCEGENITIYAQMGNISEGGLFVKTYAPLVPGTRARLRFSVDGDAEVDAMAVVVWRRDGNEISAEGPPGMGLRFEAIAENARERIRRAVGDALNGEG